MFLVSTLSFGFKLPVTGDKGAPVFNALQDDINQVNTHDHDGVDSDRIDTFDLRRGSVSVTNSGWSASGQLYRKLVTFASGFSVANGSEWGKASMKFFLSGGTLDKYEVNPSIERVSDTTFYIYSPFNNQAYTVIFI